MRYLVTGAAGFIGSAICHRLVAEGHDVVGFDDLSVGSAEHLADVPEVRLEVADVREAEAVASAAKGCDVILHQAAMKSVPRSLEEPERYTDVNVLGTLNVLLAAREPRRPSSSPRPRRSTAIRTDSRSPRTRSPARVRPMPPASSPARPTVARGGRATMYRRSRSATSTCMDRGRTRRATMRPSSPASPRRVSRETGR